MTQTYDWKEMDSAPREGYVFLFGLAKTWDDYERENALVIGFWSCGNWRIHALGQPREEIIKPTRWCNLPTAPPKTKEEILARLCAIEVELSNLHYDGQRSTVDMFGNQRRTLSEESVYLTKQLERLNNETENTLATR